MFEQLDSCLKVFFEKTTVFRNSTIFLSSLLAFQPVSSSKWEVSIEHRISCRWHWLLLEGKFWILGPLKAWEMHSLGPFPPKLSLASLI